MSLNKAMVIGNLTRDPELKQIPSGQSVCTFGVATNYRYKDANGTQQEKVEYHNLVAWGRLAEICGQYLSKGSKVYGEGRLQTRDWEGQDGVKRYRTEIVLENMVMLSPKGAGGGAPFSGGSDVAPAVPAAPAEPTINSDDEIKLEEIPF